MAVNALCLSSPKKWKHGHSSQTVPFQGRMRCRRIFRRFLISTEHISDTMRTSLYQQQDEEPSTSNSPMNTRRRYTPYGIPSRHQRIHLHRRNQMHGYMEGGPKPPERKMERDKQDEISENWFKVTIPFGIQYDKKWLLSLIQSQCSTPFSPVEFHYENMQAHFFVDNFNIAFQMKNLSDKIMDESDNKISIFISPCGEPNSVKKHKSEKMDPMTLTMNQQCATSQQFLNMQRLPTGRDVMTHPTDLALIPGGYMVPSLNMHKEDMTRLIPLNQCYNKSYQLFGLLDSMAMTPAVDKLDVYNNEVKSEGEMAAGQGQDPEELHAGKSSLNTTIPDKSNNINSILELFPKLLSLGGQESPKPTLSSLEDCKALPTCKGGFYGSDAVKSLVLQFLQHYYFIYDNGDRQGLLGAYHAEACFSLTALFSSVHSTRSRLCEYVKYSRNMKILKDPNMRRQLLKHKKCDIIHFLRTLPKTQHDLTSFVVDICFQTETTLCFSVNGIFKEVLEVDGNSEGCVHAFTRTFIANYGNNSELCIINDKLLVKDDQGFPSASMPVAASSSSYLPSLSQDQQEMVKTFYTQSGGSVERSQKCLTDDQWNYNRAIQSFALLKVKDTVPEDTFTQSGLGS